MSHVGIHSRIPTSIVPLSYLFITGGFPLPNSVRLWKLGTRCAVGALHFTLPLVPDFTLCTCLRLMSLIGLSTLPAVLLFQPPSFIPHSAGSHDINPQLVG